VRVSYNITRADKDIYTHACTSAMIDFDDYFDEQKCSYRKNSLLVYNSDFDHFFLSKILEVFAGQIKAQIFILL